MRFKASSLPSLIALTYAPVLTMAAVGILLLGIILGIAQEQPPTINFPELSLSTLMPLLARSCGIALTIAILATALSLPIAWYSRRMSGRALVILACPLILPSYLAYSSLGLIRAPGTPLGNLLETATAPTWRIISTIQAIVGLTFWIWPLAALLIGMQARRISRESIDTLRATTASPVRRAVLILSQLRASIASSIALIAILMLGSSVPLHVAQVRTYSIELWRWMNEAGAFRPFWLLCLPIIAITCLAGALTIMLSLRRAHIHSETAAERDLHISHRWLIPCVLIWSCSILAPFGLYIWHLNDWNSLIAFWPRITSALITSALIAAIVAALCFLLTLSIAACASRTLSRGRSPLLQIILIPWIGALFIPGVIVGASVSSASSPSSLAFLTDTLAGIIIAHTLRFGGIAALLGWWLAATEPRELRDARRMSADDQFLPWLRTAGRLHAGTAFAGALVIALFSFHEIEASIVCAPPMARAALFPEHMLTLLHFLRDEELSAAAIYLILFGLTITALIATFPRLPRKLSTAAPILLALACSLLIFGCDRPSTSGDPAFERIIGGIGRGDGQFVYPRAIDTDGKTLWIIDKSARVQQLTTQGNLLQGWTMPAYSKGMPVGVTCDSNGLIYVADTHEHCITIFDPNSETPHIPTASFGSYGMDLGQFIYPTDVAFMHDPASGGIARIFVSEYGGNDRITAFDPNFTPLFTFGSLGSSPAPEDIQFSRPQSILFLDSRRELIVADAANHRIGRFSPDGNLIAWIGRSDSAPGNQLGEFSYPYGLCPFDDSRILVCEYGASRIQLIDLDSGQGIATFGSPGREPGALAAPWSMAHIGQDIFVLDSKNNRISVFNLSRSLATR